ncbi:hypothetical protein BN1708_007640 [Verticillium longisporum]|uniref:NAD dependent epimerase/dehydratase n=1 Tax=Verticillium longisporum TaxID=100787 RepID=A0A0G4MV51_VERLO|nr:hypothetical protein BN1708_007640 [Verticillium longisporum]
MAYAARYRPKPVTDIFTNDTDIDRRTCSRKVPMKVLLLGLGRTGTASMRAAMRQLGYEDTYHMMSCSIENPPDALMWHDALLAKYHGVGKPFTRADWDQLLGHCQAVCDWPAAAFAPELVAAYPEAKVVLTTRDDPAAWHASTLKTFFWRAHDPALATLARLDWAASMYQPMIRLFFATFFEDAFAERGRQMYEDHCAAMRRLVPRERLLEYRVSDGWAPLCAFLERPVPKNMPFPNVNDSALFVARSRRRNRMQMLNVFARYAVCLLAFAVTFYGTSTLFLFLLPAVSLGIGGRRVA